MAGSAKYAFRTPNVPWQARLQGVGLASFRARALAFLVDGLLVVALTWALGFVTWTKPVTSSAGDVSFTFDIGDVSGALLLLAYFSIWTWLTNGWTPGKMLTGVRVVSLHEERISLWHSFERALGYAASALEAGFGFFQYFTHPNRQTVHDRIAETIVVHGRPRIRR